MTDDERVELVERMAICIAGLAWVGATSAQRAVWRANATDALSVAERVVRADEREACAKLHVAAISPKAENVDWIKGCTAGLVAYRKAIRARGATAGEATP